MNCIHILLFVCVVLVLYAQLSVELNGYKDKKSKMIVNPTCKIILNQTKFQLKNYITVGVKGNRMKKRGVGTIRPVYSPNLVYASNNAQIPRHTLMVPQNETTMYAFKALNRFHPLNFLINFFMKGCKMNVRMVKAYPIPCQNCRDKIY